MCKSSDIVFSAVYYPKYSDEEIKVESDIIEGKIRSWQGLLANENAEKAELLPLIKHLDLFLRGTLRLFSLPQSEALNKNIDLAKKGSRHLEDVLIRAIAGGEPLEKAIRRVPAWCDSRINFDCQCKALPSCNYIKSL